MFHMERKYRYVRLSEKQLSDLLSFCLEVFNDSHTSKERSAKAYNLWLMLKQKRDVTSESKSRRARMSAKSLRQSAETGQGRRRGAVSMGEPKEPRPNPAAQDDGRRIRKV